MKKRVMLLLLLISANVGAQQPPGALRDNPSPPPPPPAAAQPTNTQLMELLRNQTELIKYLSGRLEALEKRVLQLEEGRNR